HASELSSYLSHFAHSSLLLSILCFHSLSLFFFFLLIPPPPTSTLFPYTTLFRSILRSAELTGNLDIVLDQLAKYIERDLEATRTLKSALVYPTVIFCMSILTVIVLVAYVLPRFKTFFESFHAKLPLTTRMLISVGN